MNIEGNKTDADGYDCHEYTTSERCGRYDDDDFDSFEMCCNCGGGGLGKKLLHLNTCQLLPIIHQYNI